MFADNFFQITPVEQLIRTIPESCTFIRLLNSADSNKVFQREQFWIKRWKTRTPGGFNERQELPSPHPYSIKFSDQACDIAELVKAVFGKIQERSGHFYWLSQIVTAYKRNPNFGDILVRTKIN